MYNISPFGIVTMSPPIQQIYTNKIFLKENNVQSVAVGRSIL
jgi:hypothetical protein